LERALPRRHGRRNGISEGAGEYGRRNCHGGTEEDMGSFGLFIELE